MEFTTTEIYMLFLIAFVSLFGTMVLAGISSIRLKLMILGEEKEVLERELKDLKEKLKI